MQDESLMNFLEEATSLYQKGLEVSPEGVAYLASRGLSEEAVRTARLGYVSDPLPDHMHFAGMISMPYLSPNGVTALKFRRINGGNGPKYMAPLGQAVRMYNVLALSTRTDTIAVCEGEFDALIAHQMCGIGAVGISGVSNWKAHYPRMLKGFTNVLVVTDNDAKDDGSNPGQDLAARVLADIPRARNVLLPSGMDLNEFYLAEGADAVRDRLGVLA
jgi:DNA primase